jgi:hypothetical protein
MLGFVKLLLLLCCELRIWHRFILRLRNRLRGRLYCLLFGTCWLKLRGNLRDALASAMTERRSVATRRGRVDTSQARGIGPCNRSHRRRPHKPTDANLMFVRDGSWPRTGPFRRIVGFLGLVLVQLRHPRGLRRV